MGDLVFWDVDTQVDFMSPAGALSIAGAGEIEDNLRRLTAYAREHAIRIVASVDFHTPGDAELSAEPDFLETFPPHCLRGTPGQAKVDATAPLDPLWIDSDPEPRDELVARVLAHGGEIVFRKQRFDVFSNPNVEPVLEALDPDEVVLYGVALDVCDAHAIEGLLSRGRAVTLVEDAARAIDPARGRALVEGWRGRGVRVVSTEDVLAGGARPRASSTP
jgi:nicotinamidase/pyrazinamidase